MNRYEPMRREDVEQARPTLVDAIAEAGFALSVVDPLPDDLLAIATARGASMAELLTWVYESPRFYWLASDFAAWLRRYGVGVDEGEGSGV